MLLIDTIHLRDDLVKAVPQSVGISGTVQILCNFSCQKKTKDRSQELLRSEAVGNVSTICGDFMGVAVHLRWCAAVNVGNAVVGLYFVSIHVECRSFRVQ